MLIGGFLIPINGAPYHSIPTPLPEAGRAELDVVATAIDARASPSMSLCSMPGLVELALALLRLEWESG